jgi:hypothetical protein
MALGPDPESVKVLGPDPDKVKVLGPDPSSVRLLDAPTTSVGEREERDIQWIHPGYTFQYPDGRVVHRAEEVPAPATISITDSPSYQRFMEGLMTVGGGAVEYVPKMSALEVASEMSIPGLAKRLIHGADPELARVIDANVQSQDMMDRVMTTVLSFAFAGPLPGWGGKALAAPTKGLTRQLSRIPGLGGNAAKAIASRAGTVGESILHGAGAIGTYELIEQTQRSLLETGKIDLERVIKGTAHGIRTGAVLGLGGGIGAALMPRIAPVGHFIGGTAAIAKMNANQHGRSMPNQDDWFESFVLNAAFLVSRGIEKVSTKFIKGAVETLRGDPEIRALANRAEEINSIMDARQKEIDAKRSQLEQTTDQNERFRLEEDIKAYQQEINILGERFGIESGEVVEGKVGLASTPEQIEERWRSREDPRVPGIVDEVRALYGSVQTMKGGVFDKFRKAEASLYPSLPYTGGMISNSVSTIMKQTGSQRLADMAKPGLDLIKGAFSIEDRVGAIEAAKVIKEWMIKVESEGFTVTNEGKRQIFEILDDVGNKFDIANAAPRDGGTLTWSPGEVAFHGAKEDRLAHLDSLEPIARGKEAPKAQVGEGGGAGLFISDVPGFTKHFGQWTYMVEPLRDLKLLVRLNTNIDQRHGFWGPSSYQTWKREWIRSLGVKGMEKVSGRRLPRRDGRELMQKWFDKGAPDLADPSTSHGYSRELWESLSERTKNDIATWVETSSEHTSYHPVDVLKDYIRHIQGMIWTDRGKRAWAIHQRQRAIKEGYDGVIETDVQEKPEVIIFKRNAIKSLSRRPVNWVAGRDVTQGREEEWYDPDWSGEAGRIEKEVTEALTKAGALKPAEAREWERVKLFVKDLAPWPGEANLDSLIAEVESKYAGVPDRVKVGHLLATIANKVNDAEASVEAIMEMSGFAYVPTTRYIQYLRNVTAAIDDVAAEALESTAITELLMVASGGNNKYLQGLDVRYGGEPRVATPEERAATTLSPDQGLEVMGYWSVDPVRLRRTIEVFKGADLGTALHEFAHDVTQSLMTPRDRAIIERAYNYRKDPRMEGVAARVAEQRRAELLGEDFIRFMDVGELPSHLKHPAGYARDDVRGAFEKMREIALRAYKWTGGSRVDSSVEEYFEDILAGRKGRVFKDENLKNVVRWLDSRPGALPGRAREDDDELVREMMTSMPELMGLSRENRFYARGLLHDAISTIREYLPAFPTDLPVYRTLVEHPAVFGGLYEVGRVSAKVTQFLKGRLSTRVGLPSAEVPSGEKRKDAEATRAS